MTRFEKYTSDDLGQLCCKNHVKCNELLDTEDGIPASDRTVETVQSVVGRSRKNRL